MTKTILAATDGSGHAERAAERAVEVAAAIADLYNAKLILAHVLPDIVNEHLPEHLEKLVEFERLDIGEALNSIGQSILDRAQQEARKQGVKDIETVLTTGSPAKEILEIAERLNVDFIVMGSRDLEGLLMGSVSHKVTHLAKQTCITVK
jgi:nucleotide-binding universal stress UspA family protein